MQKKPLIILIVLLFFGTVSGILLSGIQTENSDTGLGRYSSALLGEPIIKDPNFEKLIREVLNKPYGEIISRDMSRISTIEGGGYEITDLSGIEYCMNLRELILPNNSIESIVPLSGLLSLGILDLSNNNISAVNNLATLPELKELRLEGNPVTDIGPLSLANSLTDLSLNIQHLSDLKPLGSLSKLKSLTLTGDNHSLDFAGLSSLRGLVYLNITGSTSFKISDIANLRLESLCLERGGLKDISELRAVSSLTDLWLPYNNIENIRPLAALTNLTNLDLTGNKIADISAISKLTELRQLILIDNRISDVTPLTGLQNLWMLDVSGNMITDPSPLTQIEGIYSLVY